MKVLHIIDSLGLGGAQTIVKGIFENQRNKENLLLFVLRKREIETKLNSSSIMIYKSSRKYSLKPITELKKIIEKENIDILHCHLFRSQVFGYILKKKYFPDIKLIFHEHGEIFQKHLSYNSFMKFSKKYVNLYLAVSEATKKALVEKAGIDPKKIVVLYNFVDLKRFNRTNIKIGVNKEKERIGIKKEEYVIGFVGRLAKVKGCEYLIKALLYLKFQYKVIIAGDGPERKNLEKLAIKLGVRNRVIFLDYIDKPERIYPLMDVLVVPSESESFGLSVVEAQAMGVQVIASDVDGLKEIINLTKSGMLFKSNDVQDLANNLNRIYGKRQFKANISIFHIKDYLKKLNKIYMDVK